MTQDIAALGYSIDSSQAVTANRNLDQLRATAQQLSRANIQLALDQQQLTNATASFREVAQGLNKDLGESGTQLDVLMQRLDKTRQLMGDFGRGFQQFADARRQVEQLGAAFGQTSAGIEAYYRGAQQLGFTTNQTVQSIQRISEALANQTIAGQQTRRVLQEYGVSLSNLGMNDADKVLQRFTERMRAVQDSAQKFRTASMVLGPIDEQTFGKLNDPDYVTFDEKRRRSLQAGYTSDIAQRTRNAAVIERQIDKDKAELRDLSNRFSIRDPGRASMFNGGGEGEAFKKFRMDAGVYGDVNTNENRLKLLRAMAANPTSEIAMEGRGSIGRLEDYVSSSWAGKAWRNMGSGVFSANRDEIHARYDQERWNGEGWLSANANRIGRATANTLGFYQGMPAAPDNRPKDAIGASLEDQSRAEMMLRFGDASFMNRFRSTDALKAFGFDISGKQTDAAADSKALFTRLYGGPGSPDGSETGRQAPGGEGEARWEQTRRKLFRQQYLAATPLGAEIAQGKEQGFLLAMPREDRGRMGRYLQFAGQYTDTSGVISAPYNYRSQDARDRLTRSDTSRGGLLLGSQQDAFDNFEAGQEANRIGSADDASKQRIKDQRELTDAAKENAAAVERVTASQQAYNQVIASQGSKDEAKLASGRALAELDERRATAAQSYITQLKLENGLAEQKLALQAAAGTDQVSRVRAGLDADMQAEFKRMRANGSTVSWEDFQKGKQDQLSVQARSQGADVVNSTAQELKNQRDLLSVAGERANVQAKFASDQRVELEFTQQIAAARGDEKALAIIRQQIEEVKKLRTELAAVNQVARDFQIGRDNNDRAALLRRAADIKDPQERRRFLANIDSDMEHRSTDALPPTPGGVASGIAASVAGMGSRSFSGATPDSIEGKRKAAFDYFVSRGDHPAVAAGRVGNIMQENPTFETGTRGDGGVAFGLGQWRDGREFMPGGMHVKNATFGQQLQYFYDDPDSIWQKNKYRLQGVTDPREASRIVRTYQERPGNKNGDEDDKRGANSVAAMSAYGPGGTGVLSAAEVRAARNQSVATLDDAQGGVDALNSRDRFTAGEVARARAREFTRAGEGGRAGLAGADYIDPTGNRITENENWRQRRAGVMAGYDDQAASATGQTRRAIEENRELAATYAQGGKALDDLKIKLQAETEARALNRTEQEKQQRILELTRQKVTEQTLAIEQSIKQQKNQNALTTVDLDPFASDMERSHRRAELQTDQYINDNLASASDADKNRLRDQSRANEQLKEMAEYANRGRDAFRSMGEASMSTLNGLIINGGSAKQAIAGLTKEFAGLLLKMAEKPLMEAGGNWLSSVLGIGSALAGGGMGFGAAGVGSFAGAGVANAALTSSTTAATVAGIGFKARGAAWYGGESMFAAGGVIDRPTRFMATGGQPSVAGEAGNEALLPLRRMANGNLGVEGGGSGGKGHSITINSKIEVSGGAAGSDGQMTPEGAAKLQARVNEMIEGALNRKLVDEKRSGGLLAA